MKKETIDLLNRFETKTGVKPIRGRLHQGSMKRFITITVPFCDETKQFTLWKNYYRDNKHFFNGLEITYLGNFTNDDKWCKKHGYEFDVYIKNLTTT